MAAFNADGKVVAVGDSVSIVGTVSAISGSGSLATVTVVTNLNDSIVVKANDMNTPEGTVLTKGVNFSGSYFTTAAQCTVLGVVTAVSGSGQFAQLTVITASSGTSVTVTSGTCRSTSQV
jgi:hypothetical protein